MVHLAMCTLNIMAEIQRFIQLFQVEIYTFKFRLDAIWMSDSITQKMASLRRTLTRLTIFTLYGEKQLNEMLIIAYNSIN